MSDHQPNERKQTPGIFAKHARYYLDRGISVFPALSNKKPAIPAVVPFRAARAGAEQVEAWAADLGEMNIAAICGQLSDLFVVDADTAAAVAMIDSLLPEQYSAPSATTPKGGRHFYFRHAPGFENWVRCREGIDIRTEGGYVLLPPSLTTASDDGKSVEGKYLRFNNTDIKDRAPVPEEIAAYLREGKTEGGRTQDEETPQLSLGRRANDIFKACCVLVEQNLSRSLVNDTAIELGRKCSPPLDEKEALTQADGAWKRCRGKARDDEPEEKDFDPYAFMKTGAELQALDVHIDWIVEKLIPEGAITLLHGPGGLGKTWLCLALAKAISEGTPFLGLATKKREVVYVDYENPLAVIHDRTIALNVCAPHFWNLSDPTRPPKIDGPDWARLKALRPGATIFFDTARGGTVGDENKSQDVALVMNNLKELRELGHEIILQAHTTKLNKKLSRGATTWEDLADHALAFYRVRSGTQIEEEGFDPNALLFLGTGEKTRYEPCRLYLSLDAATGAFTLAENPDAKNIDAMAEYIAGPGFRKNQTTLLAWAQDNLGGGRNQKFITLLQRGEHEGRWRSSRGLKGAKLYEPTS